MRQLNRKENSKKTKLLKDYFTKRNEQNGANEQKNDEIVHEYTEEIFSEV